MANVIVQQTLQNRLRHHADNWDYVFKSHPAYRDQKLLDDLREAANQLDQLYRLLTKKEPA